MWREILIQVISALLAALLIALIGWIVYRWYSSEAVTRLRIYRRAMRYVLGIRIWQIRRWWRVYSFFRQRDVKDVIKDPAYRVKQEWEFLAQKARAMGVLDSPPSVSEFYKSVRLQMRDTKSLQNEAVIIAEQLRELEEPPPPTPEEFRTRPSPIGIFSPPPSPGKFIDKDRELEQLWQWLEDEEQKTLSIAEPPGRGKTCIAAKLCDEAQQSGKWKVYWVNCSARVTMESILKSFADEWAKEIAEDPVAADSDYYQQLTNASYLYESRLNALTRWLGQKQRLIVLDNYFLAHETLNQVVIAIDRSPGQTKLLLLGRREPSVLESTELPTGVHKFLRLDPLPQEFAREYLIVCEDALRETLSEEQALAIWHKCGGEPEAMKLAAFAARRRSVDELLHLDLPDWSSDMKRWLDELTEILTDSERDALRAACIFSEPHERALLEAVCTATAVTDTSNAINGLIDAHLLERDADDRLSLHDILRDYWRSRLGEEAKRLHARAAEWLEERRTQVKQTQISPDVGDWDENARRRWADYTRRAFNHWREAGEPAKALACAEDLWTVAEDLRLLCQQALDLCEQVGDDAARAVWLRREAALLYNEQKMDAAENRYRQSLELDRQAGNELGQAQTEAALAWLCLEQGRFDEAADFANHSRLLSQQVGDKVTHAAALHVMGLVEEVYSHFLDALTLLASARSLLQEVGTESDELQEDIKRVRRAISMRTILTTVGTSLLSNARRDLNEQQPDEYQLANYLRQTDAVKASAETNSLSRLLTEGDERIVFLCSQTVEGKQCAEALARHYENSGCETRVIEVPDLTYTESRFKMRGLRSLVATLIDQIRREKAQGRSVLINATGGFKAEIAYATLVGLLFDVPVYYIHEAFRDIIEMPPTPISWDYSLLASCEEFFEWINADLRPTPEVDARLRGLPEEVRLLLAEEEGFTLLSPAGEAFYEAYRDHVAQAKPEPIWLSAQAWDTYRAAAPDVRELFDRALKKLGLRELRISGSERVRNCDCLVYPRGHRDERVFFFEADDGSVRVCELARHSDQSYERLIARGVWRNKYQDFQPWREGSVHL
ncbi:MAG TPA: putative CRISPR-associated protein [Blastocatellia bacterium]|nr:putative CRISPR-associated protein [Blastocatellia bacterium]